jgi:signal transduction histidine kinase
MVSEVAGRQARPEDQQMRDWLSLIADTSREMMDSMSDLVWAVNPDRDRLDDMTRRMRRLADEIFGARNIELRFDAPETAHDLKLGTATRREVFVIFKEAVNNIARHSLCTRVEIEFRLEGNWLSMRLSDNGRGFDAARTTDGNGLAGMRRRSKSIGGTLEIQSQPGQGTKVILKAPVTGK